ncbi:MAG: 30S ribosomal protein S4 [Dehalococcoidia bacterium]|nr:30S ribosomal protein S4 [Dehalococcoidia bacterium]
MARYIGPKNKKNRRFGLPLKNDKQNSKKSRGSNSERRLSDYGMQLREKQKARFIYGILERQFRNYYRKASRLEGITGDKLLQILESRLDNVVYRLGFAHTREQARQIVNHGHIEVNSKKVNIPSYEVKEGDNISWREKSKTTELYKNIEGASKSESGVPSWLNLDKKNYIGQVSSAPNLSDVEMVIDTRQIVEYYSRR